MNSQDFSEFLELLAVSNELKFKGSVLNSSKFQKLLEFLAIIELNLHIETKAQYSELLNNYIDHSLNSQEFSFEFIDLYQKVNDKLNDITFDINSNKDLLESLLRENSNQNIGGLLASVYSYSDSYTSESESSVLDEIELGLKKYVHELVSELQKI